MDNIQPLDAYALVRRRLVTLRMATRSIQPVTQETAAIEGLCAEAIHILDSAIACELQQAPEEVISGPADTVN